MVLYIFKDYTSTEHYIGKGADVRTVTHVAGRNTMIDFIGKEFDDNIKVYWKMTR
ncbi:MAG: hypothetical protein V1870_04670 [Candidatus Aenigmatarchaeota archaeon]